LKNPEDLLLDGETPIHRLDKDSIMKMKMRATTKFEVLMEAFCKNSGLKKETLTFWFTDELVPSQTPEQVGMKNSDMLLVYNINSKENPKNKSKVTLPSSTFCEDFKRLWNNPDYSDITLRVGDQLIPAHKSILVARCKKFGLMFQKGGMKESRETEITVGCTNYPLFLALLEYIYSDQAKIDSQATALDLMYLADEYLLPRLKEICEQEIIKSVDVKNVAALLESADKYNATILKAYCLDFILLNYGEVSSCNSFKEDLRTPELMHEVIEVIGKKIASGADYKNKKRKRQ